MDVDLELVPTTPPAVLYHGTPEKNRASILTTGLERRARHHVHLSADIDTATRVGARRGRPVILVVDAAAMDPSGIQFWRTDNGVWLTDSVAPEFLSLLSENS